MAATSGTRMYSAALPPAWTRQWAAMKATMVATAGKPSAIQVGAWFVPRTPVVYIHGGQMLAEILTIGDELCRGEIVDTNSSWMAEKLWELGITVAWMSSCRDERADVVRAFREASGRAQVVLVS